MLPALPNSRGAALTDITDVPCVAESVCAERPDEVERIDRLIRVAPGSRIPLLKHALAGILHDARRELRRIHAETIVLAGEDDSLLKNESVRALADAIPHATFHRIPASGHDLTLEQPHLTATQVRTFLLA